MISKNNKNSPRNNHGCGVILGICSFIETAESAIDIDELVSLFVKQIAEKFEINKISCMLIDEEKGKLYIKSAIGLNQEAQKVTIKLGDSFAGKVATEGVPFLVKDVRQEFPELSKERLYRYLTSSFIIVPLKVRGEIIGVLSLTDKKDSSAFDENELKCISCVGQHLALYIDCLRTAEKSKNISNIDPLTNLANHRYFQEQLQEEIYRAERYARSLAVLMVDIDKFSNYNQVHGYPAGDSVLQQISRIIKENRRLVDFVSRYGPEEFAIILPETRIKEAIFTAERIREKVFTSVFTDSSRKKSSLGMERLTVSIGVVEHKIGLTGEELIKRLLLALKEAKQKGKNCVCAYSK